MKAIVAGVRILLLLLVVASAIAAARRWVVEPYLCLRLVTWAESELGRPWLRESERIQRRQSVSAALAQCDRLSPADARLHVIRGRVASDVSGAISEFEKALQIDRRPEIYLYLGDSLLASLQRTQAIDAFVRATAFDPARLEQVPYEEIRAETRRRVAQEFGSDWIP